MFTWNNVSFTTQELSMLKGMALNIYIDRRNVSREEAWLEALLVLLQKKGLLK